MMNRESQARMKLVVDCDTGIDDAVALLMGLAMQDTVDLLAITCVNGNCSVDNAVHNTLITLNTANTKIPVYRGCSKPLSVHYVSDLVHGSDGLGGVAKEFSACEHSLQPGHAVTTLIELVNKHPGEITLLALGPLTNLAMAYRLDDGFSSKLKRLVIMGGNSEGKGNVRLAGEFNFVVDPEAAQIVVEETMCECQLCGWELCGLNTLLPWEWFDTCMANAAHGKGAFVKRITKQFVDLRRDTKPGFALCDPVAMCVALHPDIVTKSTHRLVTVETAGHSTRGMLVIEWIEGLFPRGAKPIEIVLEVDKDRYKGFLGSVLTTA